MTPLTANAHEDNWIDQKSSWYYQFHVQISCLDMSAHLDTLEDIANAQITAFCEFIVIAVSHLDWFSGSKRTNRIWNMNTFSFNCWVFALA